MVGDVQLVGDQIVDASDIRDHIDAALAVPRGQMDRAQLRDPAPTVETWGTSPEAQAGQDAMMRLLG
jgi:hypothetical protein